MEAQKRRSAQPWQIVRGAAGRSGVGVGQYCLPRRVDHLEIEHSVDDPKAYTKPWTFTTHPVLLQGELMEYICQENNKDVEHLVGK